MLLTIISYVPAVICLFGIGLLTYLKNTRSGINLLFGLWTACLASWLALLFVGDFFLTPGVSLWAVRVAAMLGTVSLPFFLFFCMKFPVPSKRFGARFGLIAGAPAVILGILCFTPLIIPAIDLRNHSAQPDGLGILYTIQSVYLIGGYLLAMVILLIKQRQTNAGQKNQIRLVVGGMAVALLVNALTGFVLTVLQVSNNYSNLIGSISFLIFVAATSYAIVKHRLFDIRLALVRTVGFLFTISLVGGLYSVLIIFVGVPLIDNHSVTFIKNASSLLPLIPLTIFIALTFHRIQSFIARATTRFFYQDLFDLRTVLDVFADTLVSSNDIEKIMQSSLKVITDAIKPNHAYFVVFNDSGRVYRKIAHGTSAPKSMAELIGDIKGVKENPVIRDNLDDSVIPRSFVADDIFLVLRLGAKEKPVGTLLFGPKQNGRSYTSQDIDLLRIGAKNLAIAVDNAKKYEQISHFANRLHDEVLQATAKLRAANTELKTLDAMKDDFISMASHQLRTPASSVHEALQMLNHSAMPLTKLDRDNLEELAEASSEHLVTVVADMLSIARIQAGHFTVTKAPVVMQDLVERVLKQTGVLAEQKHIKLIFDKPSEPIKLVADMPKINEAMSNYIENAIKYSLENTTVTVRLILSDKTVKFEVSDSGMGVPLEERKHLFSKFYRAENARMQQPDGNE
jgi:signal transduction histidine kinase